MSCRSGSNRGVAPIEPSRPGPPPSPCINVCALDADGFCAGCLRTGAEIGRWLAMSPAEQWALLDELRRRRARRGTVPLPVT
ncbi:MAG TPA: DUF1289 domain-containing protein [Steroidobacteraceae bacterium]|nr:DUF1289 domain-containing protein [Steroidobacteraceae bacterium]